MNSEPKDKPPILIFHFRLTRPQIEARRAEVIAEGFNIAGDHGEAVYYGAKLKYHYSDKTGILSLALMEKTGLSRFKTNAMIQEQAETWFQMKNDPGAKTNA